MSSNLNFLFAILIVVLIATFALASRSCSTPRVPRFIDPMLTLEEAEARSSQSGKPVFALVSADWCEPCKELKAGALSNSQVVAFIKANTESVFVDVTRSDRQDADTLSLMSRLNVQATPAMIVMRRGAQLGHVEGVLSAKETLAWLQESVAKK